MAKKDYIPDGIDAIDTFFEVWQNNIDALLAAMGLPATHADAAKAKVTDARKAFTNWKNEKAQAESFSNTFKSALKSAIEVMRTYTVNLKSTTGYTPSLGNTIGIEGPQGTFDPATAKPVVKLVYEGGQVTIKFSKPAEVKGVDIKCKRGDETVFTHVATDTNSPYNDHRDNLDITKPENREYILQYVDKDSKLIGLASAPEKITTP